MTSREEQDKIAALDFEPWTHNSCGWEPLSNAEWAEIANPVLVHTRIAWQVNHKTKCEITELLNQLAAEGILPQTIDGIEHAIKFFKIHVDVLEAAKARMIVAGLSVDK